MHQCACCQHPLKQSDGATWTDPECRELVSQQTIRILDRHAPGPPPLTAARLASVALSAAEDLHALAERDPAAHGCWRYVWESYRSFRGVLSYRVAHALQAASAGTTRLSGSPISLARQIAEEAKVHTGVEIHPAATIGRRFVIDHGNGTVIGETVIIGDDCYVLQGVVLGAAGIASNPHGRRHPRLGNRVEIGGFARVFGAITIGDDVIIGSGAVITTDVLGPARICVTTQLQSSSPNSRARIYGVVPIGPGVLEVHGVGLSGMDVKVVDTDHRPAEHVSATVLEGSDHMLRCEVFGATAEHKLRLSAPGRAEVVLGGLRRVWLQIADLEPAVPSLLRHTGSDCGDLLG